MDDGQWFRDGKPFSNPIRQNTYHVTALKRVTGGTHVLLLVVFAGDAKPPLRTGEFAVHIDDLPVRLTAGQHHPSVEHVWRRLEVTDWHTEKAAVGTTHVMRIKSDRPGRRGWNQPLAADRRSPKERRIVRIGPADFVLSTPLPIRLL